ncbi:unnamed protein product [Parascedosporium putredinis]|uniref:Heterokaryon incompatibility domain-containing protein n=1 Tax=Parascedosporium putredinis TaxID=1442378 RepID=A0A9P1ME44_9PEZI|nr:unnamed protein product [Parascedosporium putredinis]CAI8003924.1 unnamed protein product [Parascedosporium putredinis]
MASGPAKLYRSLDSAGGEIRVLQIHPAPSDKPISAIFTYLHLGRPHPQGAAFDALSYMWGDVTDKTQIQLDNEPFTISKRLAAILTTLRRETEPLVIWVDAVCINQDDLVERAAQVQLMRRIYSKADLVRVWLDEDIDISSPGFTKLAGLNAGSTIQDLGASPALWDPVLAIFQSAYWKRVWIQQEISNASAVSIHCKENTLSVASLIHYLRLCDEIQLSNVMQSSWWDWGTKKPSVILPARFAPPEHGADATLSQGTTLSPQDLDLLYTLQNVNSLKCTDERDRVYGVMFLVKDHAEGDIVVDYSSACLAFLLFANLFHAQQQGADAGPTWVPDWRHGHGSGMESKLPLLKKAGPGSRVPGSISADGLTLTVTGAKVGVVDRIFKDEFEVDVLSQSLLHFVSTCREMTRLAGRQTENSPGGSGDADETGTDEWKAVVRTLAMADFIAQFDKPGARDAIYASAAKLVEAANLEEDGFDASTYPLHRFSGMNEGHFKEAKVLVMFAWWAMISYVPFVTSVGTPGLVRKWAEPGDEIWLVEGSFSAGQWDWESSFFLVRISRQPNGSMAPMSKWIYHGFSLHVELPSTSVTPSLDKYILWLVGSNLPGCRAFHKTMLINMSEASNT